MLASGQRERIMTFGAPVTIPTGVGFYLVPQFSMMAFAAALEPLRSANRLAGRALYRWHLVSRDGGPVTASNGIAVPADASIRDPLAGSMLVVCAGINAERYRDRSVLAWLRRLGTRGTEIGAISTGAYLLAHAGLLEGRRCALHWENLASFREAFPSVIVTDELFVVDGDRFTCSGGIAALDMMLHLLQLQHGRALATAVAEQFIHSPIRDRHEPQRMELRQRIGAAHPKLLAAIRLMEANVEATLGQDAIARKIGLSRRQLERLFQRHLNRTPNHHYLDIRLSRARHLLEQTGRSVIDVAVACGFVSASHFTRRFRERFGTTPRDLRRLPQPARAPIGSEALRV